MKRSKQNGRVRLEVIWKMWHKNAKLNNFECANICRIGPQKQLTHRLKSKYTDKDTTKLKRIESIFFSIFFTRYSLNPTGISLSCVCWRINN